MSYVSNKNGKMVGEGVAFEIFKFLTNKFNFTYEIVNITNNIIGSSFEMDGSLLESLNQSVRTISFTVSY